MSWDLGVELVENHIHVIFAKIVADSVDVSGRDVHRVQARPDRIDGELGGLLDPVCSRSSSTAAISTPSRTKLAEASWKKNSSMPRHQVFVLGGEVPVQPEYQHNGHRTRVNAASVNANRSAQI